MHPGSSGNTHSKYFLVISTIIILIAGGIFIFLQNNKTGQTKSNSKNNFTDSNTSTTNPVTPETIAVKEFSKPEKIALNTMFFGDVFWGRYVDDWAKASPLKYSYPFSGLNTLQREKYDAWIADMECPITSTYLDSKTQDSKLKFSCPTEYTSEAAKWFNAFTLANNHTDNMEEVQGFKQTRENLEANKIQYFGHFDNSVKNDICEVVSFKAKGVFSSTPGEKESMEYYVPLAMCGYHNVFKLPTEDELKVISDYSKYLPTIVMPHQGKEYTYTADELQRSFYKKMIDLGADAVIADHVHSVQDTEAYKGKLIVYSLGNFIFDQQRGAQVTQAIGANLNFSFENDLNMQQWTIFSESCKKFKDNCLEKARELKLQKPKFNIIYDIIPTDNSGKLAKKADEKTAKLILEKVGWEKTKKGLK